MTIPIEFELEPFGGPAERAALGLDAVRLNGQVSLERTGTEATLRIDYRLTADMGDGPTALLIPAPANSPARRDGLWQHTCLEAFVAAADATSYWEFNLAPSGDWALYRFDGYREGQQSPPLDALPFCVTRKPDGLELSLNCPLPAELAASHELALSITAVLEQRNGAISYWALQHPGPEADFHLREGFALRL